MVDSVNQTLLVVESLGKDVPSLDPESGERLVILSDVSLAIHQGESLAIVGPSGSGKSTLLGLLAGLDIPTKGHVYLNGVDITGLNEDERALIRSEKLGFVFQSFQLIPTFTALENVMLPLDLASNSRGRDIATDILRRVGLEKRLNHYPTQLSGGEQQRVAIARAFAIQPELLFADEPTGNLDQQTGQHIIDLMFELNKERGTTLVLVTHDYALANRCDRILSLRDGHLVIEE
jgi:putative ABC transport system ATP-binding protein